VLEVYFESRLFMISINISKSLLTKNKYLSFLRIVQKTLSMYQKTIWLIILFEACYTQVFAPSKSVIIST
jgi:hypothetical protein